MNSTWAAQRSCLEVALKKKKPREFLEEYRSFVKEIVGIRKRLKNPINLTTGNPLGKNTIYGFEARIRSLWEHIELYKVAVKFLIAYGSFGKKLKADSTIEQRFYKEILYWHVRDLESLDRSENSV